MVIIEDILPKFKEKGMLKNWADQVPFDAEFKGGRMVIRPQKIVVTANYPPDRLFDGDDLGPILRRFRVWNKMSLEDNSPPPGPTSTAEQAIPDLDDEEFDPEAQEHQEEGVEGELDPEVQRVLFENEARMEGSVGTVSYTHLTLPTSDLL